MASDPNSALLKGNWVTSYSGWMHFDPRPERGKQNDEEFQARLRKLPPLIGGSRWIPPRVDVLPGLTWDPINLPESFAPREGYFVFAALTCLKFDGHGRLSGFTQFNRGGVVDDSPQRGILVRSKLEGDYKVDPHHGLNIYQGTIRTSHTNKGGIIVENEYAFLLKSSDEIEWIWSGGSYRSLVTHGTLSRVTHVPPRAEEEHAEGRGISQPDA